MEWDGPASMHDRPRETIQIDLETKTHFFRKPVKASMNWQITHHSHMQKLLFQVFQQTMPSEVDATFIRTFG